MEVIGAIASIGQILNTVIRLVACGRLEKLEYRADQPQGMGTRWWNCTKVCAMRKSRLQTGF